MEFRRLGKTNINVGIIGLGTEYVWHAALEKVEEVVLEAIENAGHVPQPLADALESPK